MNSQICWVRPHIHHPRFVISHVSQNIVTRNSLNLGQIYAFLHRPPCRIVHDHLLSLSANFRAKHFPFFVFAKHAEFIPGVLAVTELCQTVAQGIVHYLRDFQQRVNTQSNSIPEEAFWLRPYDYGNSMGNLVSHLTGNIEFYIGTHIAGTGYVRDREYEFARNRTESRADTLAKFDSAVELFCKVVAQQSAEDWGRPYSAKGSDGVNNRYDIILRCTMHLHHHIGQMIYLRKAILQEVDT